MELTFGVDPRKTEHPDTALQLDGDFDGSSIYKVIHTGSRVEQLISILGSPEVKSRATTAKSQKKCKICGEAAIQFRSHRAEIEYSISSICQACQDYYLAG